VRRPEPQPAAPSTASIAAARSSSALPTDLNTVRSADGGRVTLIQRFGSAANLNIHLNCLVLDGVYRHTDGEPVFVEVAAPSDEALQALLHKVIERLMKLLTRRGVLVEEQETIHGCWRPTPSSGRWWCRRRRVKT
jgi:hypothetical protein